VTYLCNYTSGRNIIALTPGPLSRIFEWGRDGRGGVLRRNRNRKEEVY
jgi:hypothetical protein